MTVTININDLSLVHKGSNGITIATLPDVCKTPSPGGPVPVPYPNFSFSRNLGKGTKTVNADGGNMIAIRGSEFSTSAGDEPGVLGGVKSGVNMKEAKWLTYSFNVKMEGKNTCRLTDKMTCNRANTVSIGGEMQSPVLAISDALQTLVDVLALCRIICFCEHSGKQKCVENALKLLDLLNPQNKMIPEVPYVMKGPNGVRVSPPKPIMSVSDPRYGSTNWFYKTHPNYPEGFVPGRGNVRRPDVVFVKDRAKEPSGSNLRAVVEVKFPGDPWDSPEMKKKRKDYKRIARENNPNAPYLELDPKACKCEEQRRQREKQRQLEQQQELLEEQQKKEQETESFWWGVALGVAGVAMVIGGVVSTGVLVADDATGVGAADDVLIPITAATTARGVTMTAQGARIMSSQLDKVAAGVLLWFGVGESNE